MTKKQRDYLDSILRAGSLDLTVPVTELRENFASFMGDKPVPSGITTTDTEVGGRPALRIEPTNPRTDAIMLYFHGGSFVFGSPATARDLTAALVSRTGVPALSLDYRLAPEHPFPAAIEDGLAAYRELLQNLAPEQIILAGDSAGGGLTITTLLSARDAGLPMPAGAIGFSPSLDASGSGDSMTTKAAADPIFTPEGLLGLRQNYLAGQDPRQPLLSPAIAADLTGLPPVLIQVGSNEILLDDSTRFAVRAAAADVDVILDVTAGVPHVFQSFTGVLDEADAALDRAARFVADRLNHAAPAQR